VPCKQYQLIHRDGLRISAYVARTFDGIARTSHLRKDNYFYYNCLTGRFARDNCPSYLIKDNFLALKNGLVNNLELVTGTFMAALTSRTYTKVRRRPWSMPPARAPRLHPSGRVRPRRRLCAGTAADAPAPGAAARQRARPAPRRRS